MITGTAMSQQPRSLPALNDNRKARFLVVMLLYAMQGVPVGLGTIAIPAWLAENGASPSEIGGFVALIVIPWAMKFFNGLVMDRFTYLPMGRRRAWIMSAQATMVAVLLILAVFSPGPQDIGLLSALFIILMFCATTNDTAVDALAIDVVPDAEKGAMNGAMVGAQSFGVAGAAYFGGQLLASGGISAVAVGLAMLVAFGSLVVALFRERPGERLLPWSKGGASDECEARQHRAWQPILAGLLRSMRSVALLSILAANILSLATWAFLDGVSTTLAVQKVGFTGERASTMGSLANLASGFLAVILSGIVIKLLGLTRATGLVLLLLAISALFGALTVESWSGHVQFVALYNAQVIIGTFSLAFMWAVLMRLCNPAIAASQFALFLTIGNLCRIWMTERSGPLVEGHGYAVAYLSVTILTLSSLALFAIGMRLHGAAISREDAEPTVSGLARFN